jgi:uncharacterized membrane protein YidH (DUF202 family)
MPSADSSGAPERTRLSWRRTSLSTTMVGVLLVRLALLHGHRLVAITVAALAGLCWVISLVAIQLRMRQLPSTLTSPAVLLLMTAVCLCLALLGVVLVVG